MFLKKVITWIILVSVFCCCNRKQEVIVIENNIRTISIKESDLDKKYKFYDLVENIEFIPLETTSESIIGSVRKIQFFKNNIIILDSKSRSIFIFDKQGKYVNKISRVGDGPYEYNDINDFCIHPVTGEISIATSTKKILTFSFDLKRCTLYDKTTYAVGIERFNNGNYAFTSTASDANVFVTDSSMNILYKGLPNPFQYTGINTQSFSRFGDTILCRLPTQYNDTIYRITSDSCTPWCVPDFEVHLDYSNPSKYIIDSPMGKTFINPGMNISGIAPFLETRKTIIFPMCYSKKYGDTRVNYVMYSKENKKVRVIDPGYIIKSPVNIFFPILGSQVFLDMFVQEIPALSILHCDVYEEDAISSRVKELKDKLNEDSNPVIMFLKLKE